MCSSDLSGIILFQFGSGPVKGFAITLVIGLFTSVFTAVVCTRIIYDWRITAEKPLLRLFSPILKPIFGANHRWAMARGEESLRIELARRHGQPHGEPPRATFRPKESA